MGGLIMAPEFDEVRDSITETVADYIGIEPDEVDLDKKLRLEYMISSVTAAELIVMMEDMYNIKIPISDAQTILTTRQAIDYVIQHAK